jgi:hypothetical protein
MNLKMRVPSKETIIIRYVYEDTYETLLDYALETYPSDAKVHTIWCKGKDPKNYIPDPW